MATPSHCCTPIVGGANNYGLGNIRAGLNVDSGNGRTKEQVTATLEQALKDINDDMPKHERVSQIFIINDEWTIENALLTPTMKLKRRSIGDHYQSWVDAQLGKGNVIWE